jgi:hypothetical protein
VRLPATLRRIFCGERVNRGDITAELADVYFLASELTIKAQQAERRIDRLRDAR